MIIKSSKVAPCSEEVRFIILINITYTFSQNFEYNFKWMTWKWNVRKYEKSVEINVLRCCLTMLKYFYSFLTFPIGLYSIKTEWSVVFSIHIRQNNIKQSKQMIFWQYLQCRSIEKLKINRKRKDVCQNGINGDFYLNEKYDTW